MKYATLDCVRESQLINLGDFIQVLAIEQIYHKMGIDKSEIKKIPISELQSYRGEKLILPISFPFYGYNNEQTITCFSEDIIPIFLALSILDKNLTLCEIEYLKKYQPIGCRDEYTFKILNHHGIDAYLNGCMTMTLDIDNENTQKNKVYCVDVFDEIIEKMPLDMKKKCVRRTHMYDVKVNSAEQFAKEILTEYKKNAELIITSRLHCAVPCMALGIPVIFISEKYSFRFSWLEKIVKIYTPDMYEEIDWNPEVIDISKIKKNMLENAIYRIRNSGKSQKEKIDFIHQYYMNRDKRIYTSDSLWYEARYMKNNWKKEKKINYAVWGVTQKTAVLIDYIKEEFTNARLCEVIDQRQGMNFYGLKTKAVDKIDNIQDLFVFVSAEGAAKYAKKYFDEIGKDKNTYYIWLFDTHFE